MTISQNFPDEFPTLNLNFAQSKSLDPRISFSRSSTATYVDGDGLIKTAAVNTPRFDHDPITGECLGLLVEESRTNYYITSQTLTDGRTYSSDGTIKTDFTTGGPSGGRFTRVVRDTSISRTTDWDWAIDYTNTGLSSGSSLVVSFYARCPNGTLSSIALRNPDAQGSTFNIDSNWKRFTVNLTYGGDYTTTPFFRINRGHLPFTTANGATYDIADIQIEIGSFPTSYIPTSGSQVTRSADTAQMTGTNFSSWYNQSQGTFYSEYIRKSTINRFIIGMGYDSSNYIALGYKNDTSGDTYIQPLIASIPISGLPINTRSKSVVSYNSLGGSASINGSIMEKSAVGALPSGSNGSLYLGSSPFSPSTICTGTIASVLYYPYRLPNSQLQALTRS